LSSILKALKKIEEESSAPGEVQAGTQRIDTKLTIGQELKRTSSRWRPFYLILLFFFLAISGWVVSSQNLSPVKRFLFEAGSPGGDINAGKPPPPPTVHNKEILPPPPSEIEPLQGESIPSPEKALSLRNSAGETPTKGFGRPSAIRGESRKTTGDGRTSSPTEKPEDSQLELQAIAWSSDPERRIAVISGHVVREGGSVEGVSVTQIDMDEVLVQKGGKEWKLAVRQKQ
jgi:hypothetical protein